MPNEKNQFLEEFEPKEKENLFGEDDTPAEDTAPEEAPEGVEEEEEVPEELKNRRHRRLEQKYQQEREANIALNARLQALAEAKESSNSSEAEAYLASIDRIYGNESPEAIAATEILKNALKKVGEEATARAIEQFRSEQAKEREQYQQEEATLDSMVENIEDNYNVTLSPQQKKGFFTLLEKYSPKDEDGNIVQYADADAVWEAYQNLNKKPQSRARDLSARSMVTGAEGAKVPTEDTAATSFLKEHGII